MQARIGSSLDSAWMQNVQEIVAWKTFGTGQGWK